MQEHAQHTTPRGLVDEVKATLSDARRGALVESLDILEARINELFPVDTSAMMASADDWSEIESGITNVVMFRRSA